MFSFTFDPLAAIFGISGIVGFFFFVSAAKGTSSINTGPKKDFETVKMINNTKSILLSVSFKKIYQSLIIPLFRNKYQKTLNVFFWAISLIF